MQTLLTQVRDTEFPIVKAYTYLNTASQGPWPQRTVTAVQEAAAAMQYVNTPRGMPEAAPAAQLARQRLARLLNARPDDIASRWQSGGAGRLPAGLAGGNAGGLRCLRCSGGACPTRLWQNSV